MTSTIISGDRTVKKVLVEYFSREKERNTLDTATPQPQIDISEVLNLDDYLILKDISCLGFHSEVFEQYDELYVAKDFVRWDTINKEKYLPSPPMYLPDYAIYHFEKRGNGSFLPSFALTCNILASLYNNRSDPEVERVLQQYKMVNSSFYNNHMHNTLINWKDRKIIHYPTNDDLPNAPRHYKINFPRTMDKRVEASFHLNSSGEKSIKDALIYHEIFLKDLTGLEEPSVLVEIAEYFEMEAVIKLPKEDKQDIDYVFLAGGNHPLRERFYIAFSENQSPNNALREVIDKRSSQIH